MIIVIFSSTHINKLGTEKQTTNFDYTDTNQERKYRSSNTLLTTDIFVSCINYSFNKLTQILNHVINYK